MVPKKVRSVLGPRRDRLLHTFVGFLGRNRYHLIPNHFYQPVPDVAALKDELWEKQSLMVGIDIRAKSQVELLALFSERFAQEYNAFPKQETASSSQYHLGNGYFESVDADMLYCMIRQFKPQKIFEIGSGNSTYLAAQAVLANEKDDHYCHLRAYEPYPNEVLKAGFPGLARLEVVKAEDIPLADFAGLGKDDILFIDSSHALKMGGDVQYEYLEILPRLQPGVIIHIHDIFMPAEYPREWVVNMRRYWTEQYLLQAFLSFNEAFEVILAGGYLHINNPEALRSAFASYDSATTSPSSFWMRKVR